MTYPFGGPVASAPVDFNSTKANGRVAVSRRLLQGLVPSVGDQVELFDSEGNRCLGVVTAVTARSLDVALRWNASQIEWRRMSNVPEHKRDDAPTRAATTTAPATVTLTLPVGWR